MARKLNKVYRDYSIRPLGSMEVSFDPTVLEKIISERSREVVAYDLASHHRACSVANFIIKLAMQYLPPKQRKVFFSVWCRSSGKLSKGVMEFSRNTKQSHWTNYNNYKKALHSLKNLLRKTGYGDHLIEYLKNGGEN